MQEMDASPATSGLRGLQGNHARYDGFGNKTQQTVTKGSGPSHSFAVSAATNRLTAFGRDVARAEEHWAGSHGRNGREGRRERLRMTQLVPLAAGPVPR